MAGKFKAAISRPSLGRSYLRHFCCIRDRSQTLLF